MSDSKNKFLSVFWPNIQSHKQAESLVKVAAGLCVFISFISFGASLLYKYQIVNIPVFQNSWMSIVIYGPLAYFLYEKEKIAAWTALAYYLIDQTYMVVTTGSLPNFTMILFTCAFCSAIRALNYLDSHKETLNEGSAPQTDRLAG